MATGSGSALKSCMRISCIATIQTIQFQQIAYTWSISQMLYNIWRDRLYVFWYCCCEKISLEQPVDTWSSTVQIYIYAVYNVVYIVYIFLEEAITALYRPERGGWYFTESNIYELVGGRPTWPLYARPRLYGPKGLQPKSCTGLRVFRPHWISLNPIERRGK